MIYYRAFNLIQDKQIGKGGTGTAEDPYTYYERTQIVYVEIDVDSEADLPTMPFREITTGYQRGTITYAAGSKAHAIAESTDWQINSSGQWIQQSPAGMANVYTKQQIDALIAEIRYEIADLQEQIYLYHHITTITGTSPLEFISVDIPLQSYTIYGNMTADTPPQETGDKTENLVPEIRAVNGWQKGYRNSTTGAYV